MKNVRFAIFPLVLAGAVAIAVSTLVAQSSSGQRERPRRDGDRRLSLLDGRGSQIGVMVEDLTGDELKAAGEAGRGVRVESVDGDSPAAKAGLREGDIVVEFDGERIRSARQFSRLVAETPTGRAVRLGYLRDGKRDTVEITPQSRAFDWGFDGDLIGREIARGMRDLEPRFRELEPRFREFRFDAPGFNFDFDGMLAPRSVRGRLGVQIETLSPQLAEYFGVKDGGVLVSGVTADSPAAKAGIKAGDVITSIDGDRVRGYDDLVSELRDKTGEVAVGIVRDKQESTVKTTIEPPATPTRRPLHPAI